MVTAGVTVVEDKRRAGPANACGESAKHASTSAMTNSGVAFLEFASVDSGSYFGPFHL